MAPTVDIANQRLTIGNEHIAQKAAAVVRRRGLRHQHRGNPSQGCEMTN